MKISSRRLARPFDHQTDDFSAVWKEIEEHPPRASAIISAAFVEDALRWAIEGYLVDGLSEEERRALFETEGAPLWSFHSKILLGHAIGIYGPAAKADLLTVKRIRNAFAHAPRSIDFATPEIISECTKLRYREAVIAMDERKITKVTGATMINGPKEIFRTTVQLIILGLYGVGSRSEYTNDRMP
jgi:hypothetical protein